MKNQITSRDYELISAYLDNQLSAKERVYLEARLKAVPELRKELHEISKTRLMLREMPKLRAPHNYFINAKVAASPARARPTYRFAPAMGIVSAVSTILLVLVIFGENLLTSPTPIALAPAPVAATEALVQPEAQRNAITGPMPTETTPLVKMEVPPIPYPTEPIIVQKSPEAGSATPTTIYLYAYPPTETPDGKIFSSEVTTETPSGTGFGDLQGFLSTATPTPTPSATPTPTQTQTSTPTATATATPTETAIATLSTGPSADTGISANAPLSAESGPSGSTPAETQSAEQTQATQNIDFVRYILLAVKISLAGIAIIAGLSALIIRFRLG